MKNWIGRWLVGVSALHTITVAAMSGGVLASIVRRGVFNTVGADPATGVVVWAMLFGAVLFVCGLTIAILEKNAAGAIPKPIGWSLLALTVTGVTLMPASGFWLAFPPAIVVLLRKSPAA